MESPEVAKKLDSKIDAFSESTGLDKKKSIIILMASTGVFLFICGMSIAMLILRKYKDQILSKDIIGEKDKEVNK